MLVHALTTEQQIKYLDDLGILHFKSSRIGDFVDSSRIDEQIVSHLGLSESFEFNDEIIDFGNIIVMLPTDLALQIKSLFKKCYLVCTEETFIVMLPPYVVEGVSVPNPIVMTLVELRQLDEGDENTPSDLQILDSIVKNYEAQQLSINGQAIKKIDFQYVFNGRAEYNAKVASKMSELRVVNSNQIN